MSSSDEKGMARYLICVALALLENDPDHSSWSVLRNITEKTDRNGNLHSYTYNVHGRMLSENIGSSISGSNIINISYTYDNNGNVLTMQDSSGTTTRTYDELNRVTIKAVLETESLGREGIEYLISCLSECKSQREGSNGEYNEYGITPKSESLVTYFHNNKFKLLLN
jgi:YD repeat-containing protein